jgi:hypothetical protein
VRRCLLIGKVCNFNSSKTKEYQQWSWVKKRLKQRATYLCWMHSSLLAYSILDLTYAMYNLIKHSKDGLWKVLSSGMWCHVGLVRTDVSAGYIASIFRVERICEQGATQQLATQKTNYMRTDDGLNDRWMMAGKVM